MDSVNDPIFDTLLSVKLYVKNHMAVPLRLCRLVGREAMFGGHSVERCYFWESGNRERTTSSVGNCSDRGGQVR